MKIVSNGIIRIESKGDFARTRKFLKFLDKKDFLKALDKYGKMGVDALAAATPIDSGETAASWDYAVHTTNTGAYIVWTNSNVVDNIPVAVLIQYGHATKNGGFVLGRDFINPAIQPIFDKIAEDVWKEVVNA